MQGSGSQSRLISRVVSILVGATALLFAVTLPLAYYFAAEWRLRGELDIEARLFSSDAAVTATQSSEFWNALAGGEIGPELKSLNLASHRSKLNSSHTVLRHRIYGRDGRLLIEIAESEPLGWPILSASANFYRDLGSAEVSASLRPVLVNTGLIGAVSSIFGLLLHYVLRRLPLRLLNGALARVSYLAEHDVLTGLVNRAVFSSRLEEALAQVSSSGDGEVAVLFLDLDNFKQVNDTYGHAAGDELIKLVSMRLTRTLREGDTLARLGGDEFALVLAPAPKREELEKICARLIAELIDPAEGDPEYCRGVGLSIGLCVSSACEHLSAAAMLKSADIALYQAKGAGRGTYRVFDPGMESEIRQRRALEADLRAAIANNELFLVFQPQMDIETNTVLGAEALLRWSRRGHGPVPPDQFVAIAEEIGLINEIGAWVLDQACGAAVSWPDATRIGVNVSPVQFRDAKFVDSVASALAKHRLAASRLELEITEGVLLKDTEETLTTLERLRQIGVRIAMDDFGTGYSSLGYLSKFQFDRLKIDRSFIGKLEHDRNAVAVVRAAIELCRSLEMTVIAEGIETPAQAALLRAYGCREGQGYLLSKPLALEAFEEKLVPKAWAFPAKSA